MGKNVIYPYNGLLFSSKRDKVLTHSKTLDEFQKHYAKQKKPNINEYLFIP
jgi:hypothetical protein